MAAGKSTVGKKLSRKLAVMFFDIDEIISQRHGPIEQIFQKEGEAQFREYERAIIEEVLTDERPGIIALGGGAITHDPTFDLIRERTYRVFIKISPERVASRLCRSKNMRPLLGKTPSVSAVRELYEKRMPRYTDVEFVVDGEALNAAQIVDAILQWLQEQKISL